MVADLLADNNTPINADLFKHYDAALRRAVRNGYNDNSPVFEANISRFAAYKTYNAAQMARAEYADKTTGEIMPQADVARATLELHEKWLRTEAATVTTRARTAQQLKYFTAPGNPFPCVQWLPSSANVPRTSHIPFYNRVWRKDNLPAVLPGQEWRCQCDLLETTEQETDNSDIAMPTVPAGLEGNPAITGEIFTDNTSYIKQAGEEGKNAVKNTIKSIIERTGKENYGKMFGAEIEGNPDVILNRRGKSHIAHDLADKPYSWLFNEVYPGISKYINTKPVAYENNAKIGKKPNADMYYYFSINLPDKTVCYLSAEKNRQGKLIAYSITSKLRTTVIKYK